MPATPTVVSSNLQTIRNKIRLLTRSMSPSVLTDAQIDSYVNTFVLYDFPEHLRLFNLRTTFTFFTKPFIDVYASSTDINDPLYDFTNRYITVHPPIYIAGYSALFLESREQFFGIYPMLNSISSIGVTGDGVTTQFSGVINTQQAIIPPSVTQTVLLLQNNVLFSTLATDNSGLAMIDFPISNTIGNLYVPGTAPTSTTVQDPNNYINYLTGQFVVTFLDETGSPVAPGPGVTIDSQTVPQQPTLPQTMLFYDGKFTLRPVPDQAYRVQMEVYIRPSELLSSNQSPELQEWWQYIAYGAAKKVFEDRMDLDSVQMIMPEYKKQETLILRRTIVQQTSQCVSTIYTQDTGAAGAYGPGWFSSGGQF
jgi:hypothetical protein